MCKLFKLCITALMAPKKKPEGELKDQRVPIMMSEAELKAIDDWSFENRIRSRGEAIRRLCHLGISVEGHRRELIKVVMDALDKQRSTLPLIHPAKLGRMPSEEAIKISDVLDEVIHDVYAVMGRLIIDDFNARHEGDMAGVLVGSDEIRQAFAEFGTTKERIDAFKRFSSALTGKNEDTGD